MTTNRKLMILVALIAALTMLATMTGVSFAAGGGTGQTEDTTCVVGWVINHRELPVDGTKFDPQLTIKYKMEADQLTAVDRRRRRYRVRIGHYDECPGGQQGLLRDQEYAR